MNRYIPVRKMAEYLQSNKIVYRNDTKVYLFGFSQYIYVPTENEDDSEIVFNAMSTFYNDSDDFDALQTKVFEDFKKEIKKTHLCSDITVDEENHEIKVETGDSIIVYFNLILLELSKEACENSMLEIDD